MEFYLVLGALILGGIVGFALASHIHNAGVMNAVARATTIPSGAIDTLNTKIDGLKAHVTATVAAAVPQTAAATVAAMPAAEPAKPAA